MKGEYNFHNFDSVSEEHPQTEEALKNQAENSQPVSFDNSVNKKIQNDYEVVSQIEKEPDKLNNEFTLNKFQEEYIEKVKRMENLISIIKQNAYERYRKELEDKLIYKSELENNVEILSSFIKANRIQKKNYGSLTKVILKENERLISSSQRAIEDQYFLEKELPLLRGEINRIEEQISGLNEETKIVKNNILLLERDIMGYEDEIKKFNKLNSGFFGEKENIRQSIKLLKKHSTITREKIKHQNEKSDELFSSLTLLAQKSKAESEEYDKRNRRLQTYRTSTTASGSFVQN